jgi:alginate O-acetyltransferase complex protein AlgI
MNVFLPHDWNIAAAIFGLLAAEVLLGFGVGRLPKRLGRPLAWLMTIGSFVAAERISQNEPAGLRMVAIVLAVLYAMKAVVVVETQTRLSVWQWLGFTLLWFGMRPMQFAKAGDPPLEGGRELLLRGLSRFALGPAFVFLAWAIWHRHDSATPTELTRWLATVPLLIGLSMFLHFGLFNILAGLWRALGVDCRPLFRSPALASNLNDFWSLRWNLGFSEMAALAIYRPISRIGGRRAALAATFLFSGLVHELAISVPVRAGYGLPMTYFILQGLLVLFETALHHAGVPINRRAWLGRLWVWFWIVAPLPILFHRPFLAGVVWPLIE